MRVRRRCSWCDTFAVIGTEAGHVGPVTCGECGHRADVARVDCDCPRCAGRRPTADETLVPAPVPPNFRRDGGHPAVRAGMGEGKRR